MKSGPEFEGLVGLSAFDTAVPDRTKKNVAVENPPTIRTTNIPFDAPSVAASESIIPNTCKQARTIKTKSTAMIIILIGFITR